MLTTLDVESDQVIRLELHGLDSELPAALIVMDVLGVVGVPVHAYAGGRLSSSALGVLASCSHRRAQPDLCCTEAVAGFFRIMGWSDGELRGKILVAVDDPAVSPAATAGGWIHAPSGPAGGDTPAYRKERS